MIEPSLFFSHAKYHRPPRWQAQINSSKKRLRELLLLPDETTCTKQDFIHTLKTLITQNRDAAFALPPKSPVFQFYFVSICLLARTGYLRSTLFSGSQPFDEIGAYEQTIESFNPDDLIIIGPSIMNASRILIVDEVITRLRETESFQDPSTLEALSDSEIEECLKHPKVAQMVKELHEEKMADLIKEGRYDFSDVVTELKKCGDALWAASIDSNHSSDHSPFNERAADQALYAFISYKEENVPRAVANELDRLKFPLASRGNKLTSFQELRSEMTCERCAGQLGQAIRQWADAFKKKKSQIAEARTTGKTIFSEYVDIISRQQSVTFPELYQQMSRTDGSELALSLSPGR